MSSKHPLFSDFFNDELARRAGIIDIKGDLKTPVSALVYDSRAAAPESLFFALPGIHADGHTYIDNALARGARTVVHEKPLDGGQGHSLFVRVKDARFAMSPVAAAYHGEPSKKLCVIGVTGTEGKSTTVYLIFQLLRLAGKKCGFISTVEYSVDGTEKPNPEHQTTPEATQIHAQLAAMLAHGAQYAVIESSSHGLSPRTNRLGDVEFDAAVMTNVTHEHLEFHGSFERYRHDKANLFRALDGANHRKLIGAAPRDVPAFGVVNAADPSAEYFKAACSVPVYSFYAAGGEADYRIFGLKSTAEGNEYGIRNTLTGEKAMVKDMLPGAFNAGNVLASLIAVSRLLPELSLASLAGFVPYLKPVRGRMTRIQRGQDFEVIVDYAHTPSSFEAIFPPIRNRIGKNGRIIALFGSGGERDTQKRPLQGKIASQWADIIILTDEDPRGEEPEAILEDIARGVEGKRRGESLFLIPDRPEAIRAAFKLARTGDIVLLLGKGHENSIIYSRAGKKTIAYDEISAAESALDEIPG
ncbi:MAG: UDP-N-acetylmuramoyl-L-alanyl-D-glutamate--2,6-diaminopimelate ligase [Spirochaetaceae bacterium]|nr:UDP-N-acetylmuramoyl-L-alanyl-D-glutamate--2,6-diaminopimelate ligase [Spirochaetaceae bacterium]